MSDKHVAARKAYWSSLPSATRTKRMRAIAIVKQKKLSTKQKRSHALVMVAARKAKRV